MREDCLATRGAQEGSVGGIAGGKYLIAVGASGVDATCSCLTSLLLLPAASGGQKKKKAIPAVKIDCQLFLSYPALCQLSPILVHALGVDDYSESSPGRVRVTYVPLFILVQALYPLK